MRIKTPEAGRRQTPENQASDRRGTGSPTHLCSFWWVSITSHKVQGDQKKQTYKDMFPASKVVEMYNLSSQMRWVSPDLFLWCWRQVRKPVWFASSSLAASASRGRWTSQTGGGTSGSLPSFCFYEHLHVNACWPLRGRSFYFCACTMTSSQERPPLPLRGLDLSLGSLSLDSNLSSSWAMAPFSEVWV